MAIEVNGRRRAPNALVRTALMLACLIAGGALAACTTAEGTNALVDPATFEREVMTSTLQGLEIVPKPEKPPLGARRGPLVIPKQTAYLPPPTDSRADVLPTDSSTVQIDTRGLTDAELQQLRNARVVDLRTLAGRPLTPAEQKQLTAQMQLAHMAVVASKDRPLDLPPASYFTNVGGKDTVCKTADGQLVALRDPRCPEEIRKALSHSPTVNGSTFQRQDATINSLKSGTYDGPGSSSY